MAATFQLIQQDGNYTFALVSEQGEKMLLGGEFDNREDTEKAIQDVRVGSLMSQQIAAGKVASGEMFFVIKDSSGQIIAKSLLFDNQMTFDAALHNVKDNACVAEIAELA